MKRALKKRISNKKLLYFFTLLSIALIVIYILLIICYNSCKQCIEMLYLFKDLMLNVATGIITGVILYGISIKRENLKDELQESLDLINNIIDALNNVKTTIKSKKIVDSKKLNIIKEIYKEIQKITKNNICYDKKIVNQILNNMKKGIFNNILHFKHYENLVKKNSFTTDNISVIIKKVQDYKYNLQLKYEGNIRRVF